MRSVRKGSRGGRDLNDPLEGLPRLDVFWGQCLAVAAPWGIKLDDPHVITVNHLGLHTTTSSSPQDRNEKGEPKITG